jgi:DNA-binding NtrC family response regulator
MSERKKLAERDRVFFARVAASAFTNPFGDERMLADRQAAGSDAGDPYEHVLERLLAEVGQRLAALERDGAADRRCYAGEEGENFATGILFFVFHQTIRPFDALIQRQLEAGDETCVAPFTGEVFATLQRYGFTREEAGLYVAIFYQIRRAFFFISQSLVGGSPCMKQLRKRLWDNLFTHDSRWYVRCLWNRMEDFSTLLLGETGTGKGAAAFALGRSGFIPYDPARRCFAESFTRAFVAINLSQYPESLIESELFGHRKGAFTGAVEKHDGVFSRCSPHGAIFLDEIGDVSVLVQIKLLQVLQQRTFSPVGGHEALRFEGRVIAATNHAVDALRRKGAFRDDFYYRLCSDQIVLPPLSLRLQELPSELEALVSHILKRLSGEAYGAVMARVMEVLGKELGKGYAWPGNVRELEQAVRCILLTGTYRGDRGAARPEDASAVSEALDRGELTVAELTAAYCKRLFRKFGRYEEVARRTGLDWRTVKKYVEA